jgi:predicted ArsR family transcriptional regulator
MNEYLKDEIVELMNDIRCPLTAADVADKLDISTQKAAVLMKQLIQEERIHCRCRKTKDRIQKTYTIAENDFTFEYEVTNGDDVEFEFTHTSKIRQLANKVLAFFYTVEMLLDEVEL